MSASSSTVAASSSGGLSDGHAPESGATQPLAESPVRDASDDESSLNSEVPAPAEAAGQLQGFESVEHSFAGNRAFDELLQYLEADLEADSVNAPFVREVLDAIKDGFPVHPDGSLDAGFLVSAPDFFGDAESPISSAGGCFNNAFDALLAADGKVIREIISRINGDATAIVKHPEKRPCIVLEGRSAVSNIFYSWVTTSLRSFRFASYLALTEVNFDHFGDDARTAYHRGHTAALEEAWMLARAAGVEQRAAVIQRALAKEFFALHFLTDLFAAGHVRTPRLALFNYVEKHLGGAGLFKFVGLQKWTVRKVAGLLAKAMHDEDNERGLLVNSPHRREKNLAAFMCFGDNFYFEDGGADGKTNNTTNAAECHNACVVALWDVVSMLKAAEAARRGGAAATLMPSLSELGADGRLKWFGAEAFIPEPEPSNHKPMFVAEGVRPAGGARDLRMASRRHCVRDPDCKAPHVTDFAPWKTLVSLQLHVSGKGDDIDEAAKKLQEAMEAMHREMEKRKNAKANASAEAAPSANSAASQ